MLTKGGPNLNQRIDWAFERALNRKPTAAEEQLLTGLHHRTFAAFRATPNGASQFVRVGEAPLAPGINPNELAAMTTVARAILNLHETITRN